MLDPQPGDRRADLLGILRRRVAARVDGDHAQAGRGVARVPGARVAERAQRVGTAEVPELDEHRTTELLVQPQRRDVDPFRAGREERRADLVGRCSHGGQGSGFGAVLRGPARRSATSAASAPDGRRFLDCRLCIGAACSRVSSLRPGWCSLRRPNRRSRMASSGARTCRSRSGCSAGRRRSCSSRRSSAWPCCGRSRASRERTERRVAGVPRILDPIAGAIGVALFVLVDLRRLRGLADDDEQPRADGRLRPLLGRHPRR